MNAPDASEGLDASFAKAEAREPLLGPARGFVPVVSRTAFQAWVGLLAELRECAFELSDPRVTAAKSGWWAEELEGVSRGAARHPLTRVLAAFGGPWRQVATALPDIANDADPASDLEAAITRLRPLADALVAVERHLFPPHTITNDACAEAEADADAQGRALAIGWLRHRLERGLDAADHARVPLSLFARHGLRREQLAKPEAAALRRDWAARLHAALPLPSHQWPYARLLALESDRRALLALAAGAALPNGRLQAFTDLWRAWQLARNAALQVRATPARQT